MRTDESVSYLGQIATLCGLYRVPLTSFVSHQLAVEAPGIVLECLTDSAMTCFVGSAQKRREVYRSWRIWLFVCMNELNMDKRRGEMRLQSEVLRR